MHGVENVGRKKCVFGCM